MQGVGLSEDGGVGFSRGHAGHRVQCGWGGRV